MGPAATPAEQKALDDFRELLPEDGITTAWANLTFIDNNGRSAEIDVLLLTKSGLYVVELKGWHGTIRGTSQRWDHGTRNVENPWLATDRKAKRLAEVLKDAAPNAARKTVPFLNAKVVLHGTDSNIELDERGRSNVLALDGYGVKAKPSLPKLSTFLAEQPSSPHHRIDLVRAKQIQALCGKAGFRAAPKVRMVGDYKVSDSTPIAEGPDWQDVLVEHPHLSEIKLRVRLYDVEPKAAASERQRVEQLAQREFQLTYGIRHDGIAVPNEFKKTDDGPALVFEYDDSELPLDAYLATQGAELSFEQRFALVDRLGEILRFAHQRHLIHRALSPQRVWVRPSKRGLPSISIRDWYFGQKDRSSQATTRWTSISAGVSDIMGVANQEDWLYIAPEARQSTEGLPGVPLDVYGFGTLAYLILTGRPPAENIAELERKLAETKALDPRASAQGIPDGIADVVALATAVSESDRPETISEAVDLFRIGWKDVRQPDEAEPTKAEDPLDGQAGDIVADRFIVVSRRGEGSSGIALAVNDCDSGDEREVILKIARSAGADRRLAAEADVLRALDHKRIVKLIDGPIDVDGRQALLMTDAGPETLATRLAKEGRSTIGQLQQFGSDLLEAMVYMEGKGVFHRDIKPANLGIIPDPGSRKPTLVLFDLSLANESIDNVESGTTGYLDPFLGRGRRQRYDRAAELYAVSATLFEMATGVLPWWSNGASQPPDSKAAPVIERAAFEHSVATQLTQLFKKALHPDVERRFRSADELALAWHEVFAALDSSEETAESNDELAKKATVETPLERSGLSARARSGLARLDVATVGDLLGVHPININTIRGLGETYRKEIQRRIKEWRLRLSATEEANVAASGQYGTERLVASLLDRLNSEDQVVLKAVLGLTEETAEAQPTWPTTAEVAKHLGLARDQVTRKVDAAVVAWLKDSTSPVQGVLDDATRILAREGRVLTMATLAMGVVAERGSLLDGPERARHGAALLRAAFEHDLRDDEPKLELRRSSKRATLIALHETADPDGTGREYPTADVLIETAAELGSEADALITEGVVALTVASRRLREVADEIGGEVLSLDDRGLLRLGAEASTNAAVSGFDELYPRDLDAKSALELALSGKPGRQISEISVRKSVKTRFPMVDLPTAAHELDELVTAVMPGMVRRGDVYEPATARDSSITGTTGTMLPPTAIPEAAVRLQESLRRHGALTLCTTPKRYLKASTDLTTFFDVEVLDVAALLVEATKETAASYDIAWPFVLGVDAGEKGGSDWANLTGLVREAVEPRWHQRIATESPLLVVNPGPLVRYGMSSLLAHLLDVGNPRPAARWLLVAMQAHQAVPRLEGQPVPLGPSGWITLPSDLSALALSTAG
ncbi:BREX system serine/threonine kinase PglW [Nocardioides sp. NPDC023903]|uniref:BREX system serine/threonine kinase PglW n=1 Tax=Nocardioides sp. NPDC023903 TaxID=3157195 RepID=UPI0033F5198B